VRHEIDIYAESVFAAVAIECKDWYYLNVAALKKELDAFITKTKSIGASTGVFAISGKSDNFQRYKDYLKQNGLSFWDKDDIEKWYERISRYKDKSQYQKALCDSLGIEIRPSTKAEKVFGFLRKASGIAFKTATETNRMLTNSYGKPRKQRRKGRKTRNSRRYSSL
ncbi:MAG: hypothetical protein ACREBQ_06595, partial [Nitrososphaerales archaeon]